MSYDESCFKYIIQDRCSACIDIGEATNLAKIENWIINNNLIQKETKLPYDCFKIKYKSSNVGMVGEYVIAGNSNNDFEALVYWNSEQVKYKGPICWVIYDEFQKEKLTIRFPASHDTLDDQTKKAILDMLVTTVKTVIPYMAYHKQDIEELPEKERKYYNSKKYKKYMSSKQYVISMYKTYRFKTIDTSIHKHHKITCDSWNVRGHYRHYKNGNVVFISSYNKGNKRDKKPEAKTYKLFT